MAAPTLADTRARDSKPLSAMWDAGLGESSP